MIDVKLTVEEVRLILAALQERINRKPFNDYVTFESSVRERLLQSLPENQR